MKTTLEIPDSLFRQAKASAASHGQSMATFVTAAVESKLVNDKRNAVEKPWMQFAGAFSDRKKESTQIMKRISGECERIDPEEWK